MKGNVINICKELTGLVPEVGMDALTFNSDGMRICFYLEGEIGGFIPEESKDIDGYVALFATMYSKREGIFKAYRQYIDWYGNVLSKVESYLDDIDYEYCFVSVDDNVIVIDDDEYDLSGDLDYGELTPILQEVKAMFK